MLKLEINQQHGTLEWHDEPLELQANAHNPMTTQHYDVNHNIDDGVQVVDDELHQQSQHYDYLNHMNSRRRRVARLMHHIRRVGDMTSGIYHPTLVPFEDRRIAGCLLHCVYAKNNAIDALGWPTLDGLVDFYSEGVNEHGFFMAALRSVNLCLRAVTQKHHVNRRKRPEKGESCDLAFDVFDCISDQITGYCLDHFKH